MMVDINKRGVLLSANIINHLENDPTRHMCWITEIE